MTRTLLLAVVIATTTIAHAQEPPPTKAQLDAAKRAFDEGNALYKAGKLVQAIEKLKQSYALSRNPFLLFNVGKIYDQMGQKPYALHSFRRFLATAAPNAPMRAAAEKRVAELVKEAVIEADPDAPAEPIAPPTPEKPAVPIVHQPIETVKPNEPVDVAVVVAPGYTVTLHYRGAGDDTFTPAPMTPRESDFVGQIPADKVRGNYVQYYVEVRDSANAVVARAGKSTSPNHVLIEGSATANIGLEFDPLTQRRRDETPPEPPTPYFKETWISTGVAGAFLGTTIAMYVLASRQSDLMKEDSTSCGTPPCTPFDKDYNARLEELGERYNLMFKISLGLTVASAGVAGYFWYRRTTTKQPTDTLTIVPVVDDSFAGIATTGRF